MSTSPLPRCGTSASIVSSTGLPEGTMIQITLGAVSRAQRSRRSAAPFAPWAALAFTASALRSHTTTSCPPLSRRSVMLPPIRPRPIIASCIVPPGSWSRDRRRRAEESHVGGRDDVDWKARHQPRHPALRPERGEKGTLPQLRDDPRRDSARKVHPRRGEHGEPHVSGGGPECGDEEGEGPGGLGVGPGHRPLRDRRRIFETPGERLVDGGEAGAGNHPLAGDVLVALRQEGVQRELIRRPGRPGHVAPLRSADPVPVSLPEQESRSQAGPGAEEGDRTVLLRLAPLQGHDVVRAEKPNAVSDRGEVVDQGGGGDADGLTEGPGRDGPGKIGPGHLAVHHRPRDPEAGRWWTARWPGPIF